MTVRAPAVASFRRSRFALRAATALTAIHLAAPASAQSVAPPQVNSVESGAPSIDVSRLGFMENLGQFDEDLAFELKRSGVTVGLTRDAFLVAVPRVVDPGDFTKGRDIQLPRVEYAEVRLRFEGAEHVKPDGRERESAYANYFLGNDPARWRSFVPSWSRVHYAGLYPGIDLDVRHTPDFEYDLELAPGADVSRVRVHVDGARSLAIDRDGALCIETAAGTLRQLPPRSFVREANGTREPTESRVILLGEDCFGFELPARDQNAAVTIDPPLQLFAPKWFTYWGTSPNGGVRGADVLLDVARVGGIASPNRVVATGGTTSDDFMEKGWMINGYFGKPFHGGWDVFVSEFDSSQKPPGVDARLLWTSYIGGSADTTTGEENIDVGRGIDVDADGNVYVAGYTFDEFVRDFPGVQLGTPTTPPNQVGQGEGFALKVSSDGSTLLYSDVLSSGQPDCAEDIKVDSDGNAYVTGWTLGQDPPEGNPGVWPFPTTLGVVDMTVDGAHLAGFLTKLTATGSLTWSTIIEPVSGYDPHMRCFAVTLVVDPTNPSLVRPFVTGDIEVANSGGLPVTATAIQSTPLPGAQRTAFLAGVDENAAQWTYVSYFGGGVSESWGWNIATLPDERIALVGSTDSPSFPTKLPFRTYVIGVVPDGFVAIFDPGQPIANDTLEFSSYLGGTSGADEVLAVDTDAAGSMYVTGYTTSTAASMTTSSGAPLVTEGPPFDVRHGPQDAFLFKVANHVVTHGALFGGTAQGGSEIGYGLSFNGNTVFVGGTTTSTDFHTVIGKPAAPQSNNKLGDGTAGGRPYIDWVPPNLHALPYYLDGFVLRIDSQ